MANGNADQNFYDTLVIFTSQVLKDAFDPSELMKLEEEINRLYRSNAFNITERKIHHESMIRNYPQLRETQSKDQENDIIRRLE